MKSIFLITLCFAMIFGFSQNDKNFQKISTDLKKQLDKLTDSDQIRVNIFLAEKLDPSSFNESLLGKDKYQKRKLLISEFKAFRDRSQSQVLKVISSKENVNQARLVYSLWITNVVTCFATKDVINEFADRVDVKRIDWDEPQNVLFYDMDKKSSENGKSTKEITWNLNTINAPSVWDLGYNGNGVLVGVLDTGVNYDHEDLEDHMWDGSPTYPNHGYDFSNDDSDPLDDQGHGTHCAGTVAGDGTAGSETGVAPEAQIMAIKVLNSSGNAYESSTWAGIEFAVDNGCDVLSMSFGWTQTANPTRETWRNTMDNALALGVVSAVASGNEGDQLSTWPIPGNVRTPGDCPPPWLNPDQTLTGGISGVVCVGATDINDDIGDFSSLGPVTWETVTSFWDYEYDSGAEMGLIRPDVSAPGVYIKSLAHYSNTGYADGWEGTSMATPAVAGVMALMLDKNPFLSPSEICEILETTSTDLGTAGKDNTFGAGRVDALAAVNAIYSVIYSSHLMTDQGNANGEIESGENISLSLEMQNAMEVATSNVTVSLSSSSPYVLIIDGNEYYGSFSSMQYKNISNGFEFDVAAGTPGMENIRFDIQATNGVEIANSYFSVLTYGPRLEMTEVFVSDPSGNNNGILDPGETADLLIGFENQGQTDAIDVLVGLSTSHPDILVNSSSSTIPFISSGSEGMALFNITVNPGSSSGTMVDFDYSIEYNYIVDNGSFTRGVGQTPILIIDVDPNASSGPIMETAMINNGITPTYVTSFPTDLSMYSSIFVCAGIYSQNTGINTTQGSDISTYLMGGGNVYIEGGDVWYYDPFNGYYDFRPEFGINSNSDGSSDLYSVQGVTGTFTEGMSFSNGGENNWIDQLDAVSPAFSVLRNVTYDYDMAVAYDEGTYKTIGSSGEFGGLTDGVSPSTKDELMSEYLNFFAPVPRPLVNISVFLEGPINGIEMNTSLNQQGVLPLNQPYSMEPWLYNGSESVVSIPNSDIVDWVLVEFRETDGTVTDATLTLERHCAFLKTDGSIVGLDGSSPLVLFSEVLNNLYVVIWHRNHLGIISASPLTLVSGEYNYNFSSGSGQAYDVSSQKNLGSGIWGMISGDGNGDGSINDNDHITDWSNESGESGYLRNDYNMNGQVNNPDKDDFWLINSGSELYVPE